MPVAGKCVSVEAGIQITPLQGFGSVGGFDLWQAIVKLMTFAVEILSGPNRCAA